MRHLVWGAALVAAAVGLFIAARYSMDLGPAAYSGPRVWHALALLSVALAFRGVYEWSRADGLVAACLATGLPALAIAIANHVPSMKTLGFVVVGALALAIASVRIYRVILRPR